MIRRYRSARREGATVVSALRRALPFRVWLVWGALNDRPIVNRASVEGSIALRGDGYVGNTTFVSCQRAHKKKAGLPPPALRIDR